MPHRLQPHPQTPCGVVDEVTADVGVAALGVLAVRWRIVGELDRLRVPAVGARLDPLRLWAHTCCELFVAPDDGPRYFEWNVSPSGQIARFAFSAYRERIDDPGTALGDSAVTRQGRELRLEARVPLPPDIGDASVRVALTAVIEDVDGALSYWALQHPCERPDFHHPDGFASKLTLGPALAIVDR